MVVGDREVVGEEVDLREMIGGRREEERKGVGGWVMIFFIY